MKFLELSGFDLSLSKWDAIYDKFIEHISCHLDLKGFYFNSELCFERNYISLGLRRNALSGVKKLSIFGFSVM